MKTNNHNVVDYDAVLGVTPSRMAEILGLSPSRISGHKGSSC